MFELQSYLPYLINRAGYATTDVFAEALAASELTVAMWRVLAVLLTSGAQRCGDLAELTAIEISTLSRLIGTLERRELVVRKRAPNDARVMNVTLTVRGRALTEALMPPATELEQRLTAGLTDGDVATLRRVLDQVYRNMRVAQTVAAGVVNAPPPSHAGVRGVGEAMRDVRELGPIPEPRLDDHRIEVRSR